jgi:hypothetical protein
MHWASELSESKDLALEPACPNLKELTRKLMEDGARLHSILRLHRSLSSRSGDTTLSQAPDQDVRE